VVTAKTQYNLKNAREYLEEHLCVGDYYNEGRRVAGEWIGRGSERLGLSGNVRADDFLRLCENQQPATGETLTQRLNTTRTEAGENAANRRIFYDFTFSPPKSVSIAAFLGRDARILQAHGRAVKTALREFEMFAATRIRAGGALNDRLTGNFAAALFTHDTSRALDPHAHSHCIVSTRPSIQRKTVGRRSKTMSCCGPESLPRMPTITSLFANCGISAIRFATTHAAIFKS
jgi:conjugative relaxase-like TrwC/TraI family protein